MPNENNSSAPLKTAEGAYPALPASVADVVCWGDDKPLDLDWGAGVRLAGGTGLYTAEQMRAYAAQSVAAQTPAGNWINADDVSRLVRDLDIALHGEDGAAPQAALCDVVGLAKEAARKLGRPVLAAQAAPAAEPLPLLVRDIARDLGITTLDACQALKGLGNFSVNSAVTADMARKLRECFPEATEESSAGDLAEARRTGLRAFLDAAKCAGITHLPGAKELAALFDQAEPLCWVFEDELPASLTTETYNALFAHSKVDGVRMFPVFGPQPAPQAQPADALTLAARDVLAELRRQVEVEGWTPERDDQYVHGDMASAAGCYAMYTQAFPKGDPHHTWPWDKAWWKPSKDARRNRVKACALLLAEIERLDRAAMAAAQEGGNAAKEA